MEIFRFYLLTNTGRNCPYLVLFKSHMARQIHPRNADKVMKEFEKATIQPYSHITLPLPPHARGVLTLAPQRYTSQFEYIRHFCLIFQSNLLIRGFDFCMINKKYC